MAEQDKGDAGPFTYGELGVLLGLSADGARTRAKRQGWRVIRGNDGRARVAVPPAEMPERAPVKPVRPAEQDVGATELARFHAERLAEQTARAIAAEQAAEQWRSKAEQTGREAERDRAQLELVRNQAERAERRADELAAELRDLRRPWLVRVVAALRR